LSNSNSFLLNSKIAEQNGPDAEGTMKIESQKFCLWTGIIHQTKGTTKKAKWGTKTDACGLTLSQKNRDIVALDST
jgi:hypothetical protein